MSSLENLQISVGKLQLFAPDNFLTHDVRRWTSNTDAEVAELSSFKC